LASCARFQHSARYALGWAQLAGEPYIHDPSTVIQSDGKALTEAKFQKGLLPLAETHFGEKA
jgi:hypothetical protein